MPCWCSYRSRRWGPGRFVATFPWQILSAACQGYPTYLDRYYALQPGRSNGAKRLVVLLPARLRSRIGPNWLEAVGAYATVVWSGPNPDGHVAEDMEGYEYAWVRG